MRFSTVAFALAYVYGVVAQAGIQCGDLDNQESLASCVAVPISTICTGEGVNTLKCACSQISYQLDCQKKYCSGTVDDSEASVYAQECTAYGAMGGAPAATTTPASGATPASGNTASTPAATKNAAIQAVIPVVEMLVVAVVAVAQL